MISNFFPFNMSESISIINSHEWLHAKENSIHENRICLAFLIIFTNRPQEFADIYVINIIKQLLIINLSILYSRTNMHGLPTATVHITTIDQHFVSGNVL